MCYSGTCFFENEYGDCTAYGNYLAQDLACECDTSVCAVGGFICECKTDEERKFVKSLR